MNIKMLTVGLLICGSLVGCGGSKIEVTVDPETVLENGMTARAAANARQLNFKDLGGAFKTVNDVLKLSEPDLVAIQLAAKDVKYASDEILYWFAKGSGPETGLEMEAKMAIWQDWDTFNNRINDFKTAAVHLHQTAQTGDLNAIETQAKIVGQSCKACHDIYREED
jgi:cytochrome c556